MGARAGVTDLPTRFANRQATAAQRRLDILAREKVAEAMRTFERHRVPGVVYDISSMIDGQGGLTITWTPRGRQ